jgi:hypothetical protein
MTTQIKTLKEGYYKQTPKKWRKIGDAIMDISVVAGIIVAAIASPPAWVPVAVLIVGRVGKIITNFATE